MTVELQGRRGPVLIIDHDRPMREYLRRRLEERGYEVETVHSAQGAFEALSAGLEPCLVVFDLRLLYDGVDPRRSMELDGRRFASVPVIAYTADAELRQELRSGRISEKSAAIMNRLCKLSARHCSPPRQSPGSRDPKRSELRRTGRASRRAFEATDASLDLRR